MSSTFFFDILNYWFKRKKNDLEKITGLLFIEHALFLLAFNTVLNHVYKRFESLFFFFRLLVETQEHAYE